MQLSPFSLLQILSLVRDLADAYWKFQEAASQDEEAIQQDRVRSCVAGICDLARPRRHVPVDVPVMDEARVDPALIRWDPVE